MSNGLFGFGITNSFSNYIYHNNFIDNSETVFSQVSKNIWDDGFSRGNYWSDYIAKYPEAEKLDALGVWAAPYVIDEDNQDKYPVLTSFEI